MQYKDVTNPVDAWILASIDGVNMNRYIELELYPSVVPRTVNNF